MSGLSSINMVKIKLTEDRLFGMKQEGWALVVRVQVIRIMDRLVTLFLTMVGANSLFCRLSMIPCMRAVFYYFCRCRCPG
jgi:hypothetical protein